MAAKNGRNVPCAAVAELHIVLIEYLMELMVTVEMSSQQSQKFFTNVRFHTQGEGRIIINCVPRPVSTPVPLIWYII